MSTSEGDNESEDEPAAAPKPKPPPRGGMGTRSNTTGIIGKAVDVRIGGGKTMSGTVIRFETNIVGH